MSKLNVLIVEDDVNLGNLLKNFLVAKGYDTTLAIDGEAGFDTYRNGQYDFVVLDVMMPKKDGFALAEDIRSVDQNIPILFLTAKSMKEDRLEGFNVGADDYLTKPFAMEELLARMKAILKRSGGEEEEKKQATIGKFDVDFDRRILAIDGKENSLTTRENDLLRLLYKNKNQTLDRNAALRTIWGDDSYFNGRSMDVYITKLRKHLKDDPNIEIVNVHGKGFKLLVSQ